MSKTFNWKDSSSESGYSAHLSKATSERMYAYCKNKNLNRKKFVEQCINKELDVLERQFYESLSKEELINMILK